MDWWTLLAASISLLWLLCFIDGNAMHELRMFFHALTKLAYHLYFALLQLRRAASHIYCIINFESHAQQPPLYSPYPQHTHNPHNPQPTTHNTHQLNWRRGMLHFIEAMCVVCETVPNLTSAALTLGAALCHAMQCFVYVLAAPLRTIQAYLFSQMNGEKARWDKDLNRAKETEKKMNSKVLKYISVLGQGPSPLFASKWP